MIGSQFVALKIIVMKKTRSPIAVILDEEYLEKRFFIYRNSIKSVKMYPLKIFGFKYRD